MARKNPTVDPDVKARALALAAEIGATEAARQTGVPRGTIVSWRSREGLAERPSGVSAGDWADAKRTAAENAWNAATEALEEIRRVLAGPKNQGVQGLAITYGVLLDKATQLEAAAQAAEAHRVRIETDQWRLFWDFLMLWFESLGVEMGKGGVPPPPTAVGIRSGLAALAHQYGRGEVLRVPPELVEKAKQEIRDAIGCGSTCCTSKHSTPENPRSTGRLDADEPADPARLPLQLPESTDSTGSSVVDAQVEPDDPAQPENSPELCAVGPHTGRGWPTRPVSGSFPETDLGEVVSGEILCEVDPKEGR